MKIKGLLFGSAAALAMSGAASAADLPVAAVSSCAAGTLDIGGGVCMDISGYTRLNMEMKSSEQSDDTRSADWDADARLQFKASSETEMGALVGTIRFDIGSIEGGQPNDDAADDSAAPTLDRATVQLGGFIAGYTDTLASSFRTGDSLMDLSGDNNSEANMIGYVGSAGSMSYAIALEENRAGGTDVATTTPATDATRVTDFNALIADSDNAETIIDDDTSANSMPALALAVGMDMDMFSAQMGAHITSYDFVSKVNAAGTALEVETQTGFAITGEVAFNPTEQISAQIMASYGTGNGSIVGDVGADDFASFVELDKTGAKYVAAENWAVSGSLSYAATDTVSVALGAAMDDDSDIEAGVNVTWAPVSGFSVAAEVMGYGHNEKAKAGRYIDNSDERMDFLVRINRSF